MNHSQEYIEGFNACRNGVKENPYTDLQKSNDWEDGWNDACEGNWSSYFPFNDGE